MLQTEDFHYHLPEELIATSPLPNREASKLLVLEQDNLIDDSFKNLLRYLKSGDLLVLNNSKVIKARLFGKKTTGAKVEVLVERILDNHSIVAHVKTNKTISLGLTIVINEHLTLTVVKRIDNLFLLNSNVSTDFYEFLEQYGAIPLPPYMHREANITDDDYYQTVYAKYLGSIAAPTAGLHFTRELLDQIQANGINIAYVTLHVGSGTFKPVTAKYINEHKMHSEHYVISKETVDMIKLTKNKGARVIAVGTTSLRTLEAASLCDFDLSRHETDIFITPGFKFQVVDALITNFHLPKSTLLMLVSAFAGTSQIQRAYAHAISMQYRFYSYGDAMLLYKNTATK